MAELGKRNRYDASYLKLGFNYLHEIESCKPHCVLCSTVLTNQTIYRTWKAEG